MPADSIVVAIGVCLMFLVFATVLAWADHATSQWLRDRAAKETATGKQPPRQEAA